jgi:hypothetical protein
MISTTRAGLAIVNPKGFWLDFGFTAADYDRLMPHPNELSNEVRFDLPVTVIRRH